VPCKARTQLGHYFAPSEGNPKGKQPRQQKERSPMSARVSQTATWRLVRLPVFPQKETFVGALVMVAVGTRIAPRPPRRSRRALLTHRAPPSGQTSAAKSRTHLRSDAPLPIGSTWLLGSASEPRPFVSCFPWVRPFPPRPPPEVAFLCSIASSVLWPHPTSHPRAHSACVPSRPGTNFRAWMRPPRFRQRTSPRAQGLRLREVHLMRAILP
jgi:hypothetical protein